VERELLMHCFTLLEETYNADPFAQFPKALYKRLGKMLESVCMEFTHVHELAVHYEPGYLSGDVFYGFGHYLRRFRLPGSYTRDEQAHGYDVVFCGESSDEFMMECEMIYGYTKDGSESRLGEGYVKCDADDIISFDIGGSSFVRYAECEKSGKWRAEAEVFIKDEIYRFAAVSKSYDGMRRLHDALRGAMNVEDWYDEVIREESPDPHANGATFCINGAIDASGEYIDGFPYSIELFDIPHAIQKKLHGGAKKEDVEAFLHELFESLSERDEDGSEASDEE